MSFVGRSDAVVALRSFARRYAEAVSGPEGDDAWDRLVRHAGLGGRSALGHTVAAVAELDSLANLLRSMTTTASLAVTSPRTHEPAADQTIDSLIGEVKTSASAAADALDARRDSDYDTEVIIDARKTTLGEHVSNVVNRLSAGLRLIDAAIESARDR